MCRSEVWGIVYSVQDDSSVLDSQMVDNLPTAILINKLKEKHVTGSTVTYGDVLVDVSGSGTLYRLVLSHFIGLNSKHGKKQLLPKPVFS